MILFGADAGGNFFWLKDRGGSVGAAQSLPTFPTDV